MTQNSKNTESKRYCIACKRRHTSSDVGGWPGVWNTKQVAGKKVSWCRLGIDCYGCGQIHYNDTGFTKTDSRGSLCGKWAKSAAPSLEQKMANMSPEEVMSGVQYGGEMLPYFEGKSSNNFSEEHREQVKQVEEALQ